MIHVTVNLSDATPDEIEAFYALAGVGRALDALAHDGRQAGVQLALYTPPAHEPADLTATRLDPIH